ncbi:MAG: trans-aconitate 2-methyltransferase [Alphaproteobacteria bacterium]
MKTLQEKSDIYYAQAAVYEAFSAAEDAGGLVLAELLPAIKGKTVLDLGCGTGKYTALLAPHAKHITGLDAAPAQLDIARERTVNFTNVDFIEGDAAEATLQRTYDVVLACWMLGTIADEGKRGAILDRLDYNISFGGEIFLVENAEGSEFERIRGRVDDPEQRTKRYNDWVLGRGFRNLRDLDAHFEFETLEKAREIFGAIWGDAAAARITAPRIQHKITIYRKVLGR